MNVKSMPWWGKLIAAAVVCGGLVFSQYKMAPLNIAQTQQQIEKAGERLEKNRANILKGRQAQAQIDELQRDIASLERKLTDLRQILPTEPELGDLLKWIKALADQTNLDLRIFNPQGLTEQEFLREQPIRMEVIGSYHQLGLFFDRISKYQRIINVENVVVNPAGAKVEDVFATITATFTAKTYIYRDENSPPAEGDKL
ncbi:MAG: type 4a pilus biogenesis protein PilO [Acidobacteria bacterium]|nr:type 4a pilus biogenesis protein PilO [Acidobacteriota bacterium]